MRSGIVLYALTKITVKRSNVWYVIHVKEHRQGIWCVFHYTLFYKDNFIRIHSSQRGTKSHLKKNTVPPKEPIPTWNDIT